MVQTTQKTVFCETNIQYFDIEQGDMIGREMWHTIRHNDKTKDTYILNINLYFAQPGFCCF